MSRATSLLVAGCILAVGTSGCQSSVAGPNGLFTSAPARVPAPPTGSYGKAAKYYGGTSTAANPRPTNSATPSPSAGASNLESPPASTTTLPALPPTEIVPAVHSDNDYRPNTSQPVAPTSATIPTNPAAPLRWGVKS